MGYTSAHWYGFNKITVPMKTTDAFAIRAECPCADRRRSVTAIKSNDGSSVTVLLDVCEILSQDRELFEDVSSPHDRWAQSCVHD